MRTVVIIYILAVLVIGAYHIKTTIKVREIKSEIAELLKRERIVVFDGIAWKQVGGGEFNLVVPDLNSAEYYQYLEATDGTYKLNRDTFKWEKENHLVGNEDY